jgi:uncharacterized protein (TIGR03382 family)
MNRSVKTVIVGAGLLAGSSTALATPISFGFANLDGTYTAATATSGSFSAQASGLTGGNVLRDAGLSGTADFLAGFLGQPDPGNVTVNLSYLNSGPGIGTGAGSIVVTDATGDTMTVPVAGTWSITGSFIQYTGIVTGASFANNSLDGLFNGSSGGSFGFTDLGLLNGQAVTLVFNNLGTGLTASFANANTGINGKLIPTPGALALLGLAGAAMGRRRR